MKKKNELEDDEFFLNTIIQPFLSDFRNTATTQPSTPTASNSTIQQATTAPTQPSNPATNQASKTLQRKTPIKSFSIKGSMGRKEEEQKVEEERLKALSKNESFSQNDLIRSWNDYTRGLTEKQILKNTMIDCKPTLEEDCKIIVHVDNSVQKEQLEIVSVSLTNHLRESLKNGKIEMVILVNEMGDNIKTKTSHELFTELKESSPQFAKFAELLKLEIE